MDMNWNCYQEYKAQGREIIYYELFPPFHFVVTPGATRGHDTVTFQCDHLVKKNDSAVVLWDSRGSRAPICEHTSQVNMGMLGL